MRIAHRAYTATLLINPVFIRNPGTEYIAKRKEIEDILHGREKIHNIYSCAKRYFTSKRCERLKFIAKRRYQTFSISFRKLHVKRMLFSRVNISYFSANTHIVFH